MVRLQLAMRKTWQLYRRFILLFSVSLFMMLALVACPNGSEVSTNGSDSSNNQSQVTVGIQVSPAMTLVMVAQEKGFFQEEGVNVEIKEFTAGKFALQAFLGGSIDFAVSGEVPVALATLQGNKIRVVSQVVEDTTNEVRVVALKDGELKDPTEYFKKKRRKLATSIGGGPEFYTYEFLKRYQIKDDEIEIVSQKPEDMPAALASGSVDAISIFDPFAFIAEKRLRERAITFTDPELYSEFYVLDARPEQIEQQSEEIESLLKGLKRAGEFIDENPEEAKQILQDYTKLERDVIDGIWNNFVFKPALTQKLIDYWNAQGDWAKETGKVTPETSIPNFRDIVDSSFLEKVDPSLVKLNNS
ncbi:MAG: ABC transporter substrate-binding protein [Symploca sp. SIO1C2]|nr:ABC transporter substrate-binding protein [Symploca sp. SIO1C2]